VKPWLSTTSAERRASLVSRLAWFIRISVRLYLITEPTITAANVVITITNRRVEPVFEFNREVIEGLFFIAV
jgi:hypothetical protein